MDATTGQRQVRNGGNQRGILGSNDCRPGWPPAIALGVWLGWMWIGLSVAAVAEEATADPPPLTIETLFDPQQKYEFVDQPPHWQWVSMDTDRHTTTLACLKDSRWTLVDLETGDTEPWGFVDRLKTWLAPLRQSNGTDPPAPEPSGDEDQTAGSADSTDRWIDHIVRQIDNVSRPALIELDNQWLWIDLPRIAEGTRPSDNIKVLCRDASRWLDATLSPNGQFVGYTHDGDLYVHFVPAESTRRLTNDGSPTMQTGRLDWIYQEEIYGRGQFKGFWFSPDSKRIAALRIGNDDVNLYRVGDGSSDTGSTAAVPYPVPGQNIPVASLSVYRIRDGMATEVVRRSEVERTPVIINGVWWDRFQNELLYCVSDRRQQHRRLMRWQTDRPEPQLILEEHSHAWIEPPRQPLFGRAGLLYWYSQVAKGRGRVYTIGKDGGTITAMTPDDFHVRDMFLAGQNALYVTGAEDPAEQHVYEVRYGQPASPNVDPQQLIPLTSDRGWHQPEFAPVDLPSDQSRCVRVDWIDRHSTIDRPPTVHLHRRRPKDSNDHPPVRLHDGNLKLNRSLQPSIRVDIPVDDTTTVPGFVVMPTDPAKNVAPYPVIVEIYGGPQAAVATHRWRTQRRLVREIRANAGIATLTVDNRSSVNAGTIGSWPIAGQFGELESADTVAAIEWLTQQQWVDADRIGLTGWSFGGYLTLRTLIRTDKVAAAVAGGSVTDWRGYDAFYTERYMGTPADNPDGYASSSILGKSDRIQTPLLLIHGEIDDNVHPGQTLQLVGEIQQTHPTLPMQMMIYPGQKHGIESESQRYHLHRTRERFFRRYLGAIN